MTLYLQLGFACWEWPRYPLCPLSCTGSFQVLLNEQGGRRIRRGLKSWRGSSFASSISSSHARLEAGIRLSMRLKWIHGFFHHNPGSVATSILRFHQQNHWRDYILLCRPILKYPFCLLIHPTCLNASQLSNIRISLILFH